MNYIGIDNGLQGGIVVLNEKGNIVSTHFMPIIHLEKTEYDVFIIVKLLKDINKTYPENKVFLEKAHVRPIQGIRAAFTTGYGLGMMQAILTSLNMGYEVVNPTVWMKTVFEGNYNKENKKYSTIFSQRKWPETDWRLGKNIHDGITDAACIAYYGYLKDKGNN